jgi:hypothetical protein
MSNATAVQRSDVIQDAAREIVGYTLTTLHDGIRSHVGKYQVWWTASEFEPVGTEIIGGRGYPRIYPVGTPRWTALQAVEAFAEHMRDYQPGCEPLIVPLYCPSI